MVVAKNDPRACVVNAQFADHGEPGRCGAATWPSLGSVQQAAAAQSIELDRTRTSYAREKMAVRDSAARRSPIGSGTGEVSPGADGQTGRLAMAAKLETGQDTHQIRVP